MERLSHFLRQLIARRRRVRNTLERSRASHGERVGGDIFPWPVAPWHTPALRSTGCHSEHPSKGHVAVFIFIFIFISISVCISIISFLSALVFLGSAISIVNWWCWRWRWLRVFGVNNSDISASPGDYDVGSCCRYPDRIGQTKPTDVAALPLPRPLHCSLVILVIGPDVRPRPSYATAIVTVTVTNQFCRRAIMTRRSPSLALLKPGVIRGRCYCRRAWHAMM